MLEVVAGIIESENGILLCQRHRNSRRLPLKWEFPGGKVETNEGPKEAIIRELDEELGIKVLKTELLHDYKFAYPDEKTFHLYFFKIHDYDNTIQDLQFEKIEWVKAENLNTYDILEGDQPFLHLYYNQN
ncbi:MAG: (deoxy)nucleoside triphosphate pyrophosphohydrolase [Candidatus Neomarinimicrobiota bacterium]|jgi:8-oxo-dGTP diphosphatase